MFDQTKNLKLRKFREEGQLEQKFPVIIKKFRYTAPRMVVLKLRKMRQRNGIEVRKLNLQQALHISGPSV